MAALSPPRTLVFKISRATSCRYRPIIADVRAIHRFAAAEDAPALSRKERRERKRHAHEAQKKAKAIDKAHDKDKTRGAGKDKKGKDKKRK